MLCVMHSKSFASTSTKKINGNSVSDFGQSYSEKFRHWPKIRIVVDYAIIIRFMIAQQGDKVYDRNVITYPFPFGISESETTTASPLSENKRSRIDMINGIWREWHQWVRMVHPRRGFRSQGNSLDHNLHDGWIHPPFLWLTICSRTCCISVSR